VGALRSRGDERLRAAASRELDVDFVLSFMTRGLIDRSAARILLHSIRHLERFDERVPLDVLERDTGRRNDDYCRVIGRPAHAPDLGLRARASAKLVTGDPTA
jgi:hypothetical protein